MSNYTCENCGLEFDVKDPFCCVCGGEIVPKGTKPNPDLLSPIVPEERLAEIETRAEAATKEEIVCVVCGGFGEYNCSHDLFDELAQFPREDIPWLIQELRTLYAERDGQTRWKPIASGFSGRCQDLESENARLRKALEDAEIIRPEGDDDIIPAWLALQIHEHNAALREALKP